MNTVFSRKMVTGLTTLLMVLLIPNISQAQFNSAPAFPGAEGYGRYTTGGRGGTVYHVTTLEDYCDNTDYSSTQTKDSEISGSLRSAVKKSGARIIVFDVAGTIELKAPLKIANDNITILGQTAPGNGICLKNYTVSINANNVIIRYIRCRLGSDGRRYYSSGTALTGSDQIVEDDAMNAYHKTGSEVSNIIIDHCSISWSVDECGSFYGNKDFTLQWCMLTESLKNAGHTKGAHGYGGIWGGERASFHHNLIADHDSRNPRFDHGYVSTLAGPVDYTNNVLYNWGGNSAYGGENKSGETSKKFNMINNYYRYGGATSDKDRLLNPTTYCSNCNSSNAAGVVPGTFYISGNYMYGSSTVTNDNTCSSAIVMDSKGLSYSNWLSGYVSSTKFQATTQDFGSYNNISIQSAETSYNKVLDYAGASYSRDATDTRVCNDAKNGTTSYTTGAAGSNGATGGLIDQPTDVGGYPTLTGTKATDTDNDGIPDEWETEYGLDNSTDNSATYTLDSKGYYTDLEVYANSLVENITKAERADATETFEEYYPTLTSSSSSTETTIFSLASTATNSVTVAYGTDQDLASYATITGGSALIHNGHNSKAANMITASGLNCGNSGGSYIKVTLNSALQTGDILTTTGGDGGRVALVADNTSENNISGNTFTFTSNYNGQTVIYINRGASTYPTISGIAITRGGTPSTTTTYTVSYDLNGHGDAIADVTGVTALPSTLPTPTASGYTFGGWYTDSGLTSSATAGASISANTTLYAKWTANSSGTTSAEKTFTFLPADGTTTSANSVYTRTSVENPNFSITSSSKISSDSRFKLSEGSSAIYSLNIPSNATVSKVVFTNCSENYYSSGNTTTTFTVESSGATVSTVDANGATLQYLSTGQTITSTVTGHVMGTPITFVANGGQQLAFESIQVYYTLTDAGSLNLLAQSIAANATVTRSGKISFTFDNDVTLASSASIKLDGTDISTEVSGPSAIAYYTGLEYGSSHTITLAANSVSDEFGNKYATAISVPFTINARPTVTKAGYDAIVSTATELDAALAAANARTDKTTRYRIFVKNGTYILAGTGEDKTVTVTLADKTTTKNITYANPTTYLKTDNVSLIGESMDGVVITNKASEIETYEGQYGTACAAEGIGNGDVLDNSGTLNYFQGLTLKSSMGDGRGRDVVLQDKGNKTIIKDACLWGYQDTYTTNNTGRFYFEGGVLRGRTDYLCGKGDVYYNKVTLQQCGTGGYLAVPSQPLKYGYIFNECYIKKETSDVTYYLGRPWGSGTPIAMFINTTVDAVPLAAGWAEMNGGWPNRFAEYNTKTISGSTVDTSSRKTTFNTSYTNNPILTAAEATYYSNMTRILSGSDGWDPTEYTEQCSQPTAAITGTTLSWTDDDYASSWVVLKDGSYYANPTTNSLALTESGSYTVRAANFMGGLGTESSAVSYTSAASFAASITDGESKTVFYNAYEKQSSIEANACPSDDFSSIKITYGSSAWTVSNSGITCGEDTYTGIVSASSNGSYNSNNISVGAITLEPKYSGTITLAAIANTDKAFYICDRTANKLITDLSSECYTNGCLTDNKPKTLYYNTADYKFYEEDTYTTKHKLYGTIVFSVEAGHEYSIGVSGSKMGLYGFKYQFNQPLMALDASKDYSSFESGNCNVNFTKTFPENKWTSLVLPFSLTEEQLENTFNDVQVASINSIQDNTLYFVTRSTIAANCPVLIKVVSPKSTNTYTFNDVTVVNSDSPNSTSTNGVQMRGLYEKEAYNEGQVYTDRDHLYFIANSKFYDWSYLNYISSFSAYIYADDANTVSAAKPITFVIDGIATDVQGVSTTNSMNSNEAIYNLTGQRVSKNAKGILIINGKKHIK